MLFNFLKNIISVDKMLILKCIALVEINRWSLFWRWANYDASLSDFVMYVGIQSTGAGSLGSNSGFATEQLYYNGQA